MFFTSWKVSSSVLSTLVVVVVVPAGRPAASLAASCALSLIFLSIFLAASSVRRRTESSAAYSHRSPVTSSRMTRSICPAELVV